MTPGDGNAARAIAPDDIEQAELDQAEHDELVSLRPHERRALEARSGRAARVERLHGATQAWARLRPEDRKLMEQAVDVWGKMLRRSADGRGIDPLVRKVWEGGQSAAKRKRSKNQSRARFGSFATDPKRVTELDEAHSAVEGATTIFPKSVTAAWDTDRLLVSGKNNSKLGGKVEKGEWAGMPIFHLTLEERATCPGPDPRTGEGGCPLWRGCYGNAMHLARRHDARSENFLDFLQAELWLMARSFPDGFVVRLHTLGDFYSVEYVEFWRDLLMRIKPLRVWGYTARAPGDPIRDALQALVDDHWDRFAIRWSNTHGYQGAIVVDDIAEAGDAIPCPQQHTAAEDEAKTDSCATCGLCWNNATRGKTIAFLRHGMKTRGASE